MYVSPSLGNQLFSVWRGAVPRGKRMSGYFCQVCMKLSQNVGTTNSDQSYVNVTLVH